MLTTSIAIGTIVILSIGLLLSSGSQPSPSNDDLGAGSSLAADPPIVWDSGSVRLEADALEIKAGDKVFTGQAPYTVSSVPGNLTSRTLEIEWTEDGLEQRLHLAFAADEQDWWISQIRTRDGYPDADWITYDSDTLGEFLLATPRGETHEGDLHVVGGQSREDRGVPGELNIAGLRLTAFAPGTGPGPLADCENVRASVRGKSQPLDKGQPLAGTGIEDMSPTDAEALLREMGICFTFRYRYPTSEERSEGYSERWCTAPPAGSIGGANSFNYLDASGEVMVFVSDDRITPLRDQPPEGWGCPAG